MEPLAKPLRRQLENVVVEARETADTAARAALTHLAVGEAEPPRYLTEPDRALRRRLRAHGRQLGDHRRPDGRQAIDRLAHETAYEHWHRMLFARFLAESGLLMHPDGVAVSLDECHELAPDEGAANGWELAGRYASRMLPQIFRPDSPVLALSLAPEHQRALERLLADLPPETFQAGDSLGWVYQFWQTKKKDELRRKAAIPGVPLEYLRFVRPNPPSPSGRGAGGEGSSAQIPSLKKPLKLPEDILEHARELRRGQTDAEQLLWGLLRDRRLLGKKFRRQHPVGGYILDVYCHEHRLAIELDGGQHGEQSVAQYDEERTKALEKEGIRVVRFWNNEVLGSTEAVLQALYLALTEDAVLPSPPTPLPLGEG